MKDLDSLGDRELKESITRWLSAVREAATAGLEENEAIRRAEELETLVLAGKITSEEIQWSGQFKDVLYALVYRVLPRSNQPGNDVHRAGAIYDFIDRIRWSADDLEEKQDLLNECAAAGGHSFYAGIASERSESAVAESAESYRVRAEADRATNEQEPQHLFESVLPLIRTVLIDLHKLTDAESREIEKELLVWFLRFSKRESAWTRKPRAILLAAASEFARQYRRFGAGAFETSAEAELSRLLEWALSGAERR